MRSGPYARDRLAFLKTRIPEARSRRREMSRLHCRRAQTGSVSIGMIFVNSTIDPGQPWVIASGIALGFLER